MEAFLNNIDALEQMLTGFFQKWEKLVEENKLLIQRNTQLETELRNRVRQTNQTNSDAQANRSGDALDQTYIINAINRYIVEIDDCIEYINMELDG